MTPLRRFAAFWWGFVVGDDWRVAAAVVLALAGTWALADTGTAAWWLVPLLVCGGLALSVATARGAGTRD